MSKAQKDRPRLGRGLSSLISMGAPPPVMAEVSKAVLELPEVVDAPLAKTDAPREIPLADIVPNPHQPRKRFSETSLAELAASIRSTGLIQPIIVRRGEHGYELIAGERRWRAATMAGLHQIPAIVRQVDGFTQAQMALVENVQREDLNAVDRAQAYRTLMDQLGLTQAELATRLGEERSSIANYLRVLELAEPVRTQVAEGLLSRGHAKIVAQGLSVRNLERALANGAAGLKQRSTSAASAHLLDVEKNLARQLGMRVQLRSTPGKGRGRVVIHYASLDQFDDLLQRLGVKLD
jgi:ParB family chromosome partitioning protein